MPDFDNLPDPSKFKGKTATDNTTGARFFSNGRQWSPIPSAQQPGFGTEDFPTSPAGAFIGENIAGPMLIPGALELGAAAMTGPAAPFAVPAAGIAGEAINQALGITERSNLALGISGFAPLAARGLSGAGRAVSTFLKPSKSASLLNILGEERAVQLAQKFRPGQSFKALFGELGDTVVIPTQKTMARIDDFIDDLSRGPTARKVFARERGVLKALKARIEEVGGGLSPLELQNELQALGMMERRLSAQGGSGFGSIKGTMESLFDDLDAAADNVLGEVSEQAATLRTARQVFLRQRSVDRFLGAIENAFQVKRGTGDIAQFNPQQVIQALQRDRFFPKAFNASEQAEIFKVLKQINRIPTLPPGAGVPFGSGRFIRGAFGGGIVGGVVGEVSERAGLPITAQTGAAIGTILPFVTRVARDVALALQFPDGRRLISALLKGTDGAYTPRVAELIGAFLASKYGTTAAEPQAPGPALGG